MLDSADGQSKTYDYLGQDIEKFIVNHIPADNEPCKDYELAEIDSTEIKKIGLRMSIEKDYKSTTYHGMRDDGSKYIIAQVGDNEINAEKYYRYFYADESQDGKKLSNITLLYSKTNVAYFINERKFGRKIPEGYVDAINNVLFSLENIRDSYSKGTFYIGQVRKIEKDNKLELASKVSEIPKSEEDQKLFRIPTKRYVRNDGSCFIVQQMSEGLEANGVTVNCYHIFEAIEENGAMVVKRNVVYSEQDLLKDSRKGIANDFLSRSRLDRKVGEAGGYIGFYDEEETRRYNPKLVSFFRSTKLAKTKRKGKEEKKTERKSTTNAKKLTPDQIRRKIQWIRYFIRDYDNSEEVTQRAIRANCEEQNIQTVLKSIKTGKFSERYDNNAQDYEFDISRVMPSMARLLIAADCLTIDAGENYLTQFVSLPQIDEIMLKIKNSNEYKQMHSRAESNRRNNTIPCFRKTRAEMDKENAQNYIRSAKLTKKTLEKEIIFRKGLLSKDKIQICEENGISSSYDLREQQISLIRVLARQEGKKPGSEEWDKTIGWYFCTDINEIQNSSEINQDTPSESYIIPSEIAESTIKIGTGKHDINAVIQEIKRTQNKDLQETREK